MTDIKQQAVSLREQGFTYKQISEALSGELSVDWLRRNISYVKKGVYVDELMEELIREATKPEGCSNYEASAIIYKHKDEHVSYDVIKGLKTKAISIDSKCLFYPGWISPSSPVQSHTYMNTLAFEIYENIQYAVDRYTEAFPDTNRYSVLKEIVSLAHADYIKEPLGTRLERNSKKVEQLSKRLEGDFSNYSDGQSKEKHYTPEYEQTTTEVIPEEVLDDIWLKDIPY